MKYKWIDDATGELATNIFDVLRKTFEESFWCLRNHKPQIRRKWKYNKEGW